MDRKQIMRGAGPAILAAWVVVGAGCKGDKPNAAATAPPAAQSPSAPVESPAAAPAASAPVGDYAGPDAYDAPSLSRLELPSGVIIEDLKVGHGEAALPRAFVIYHYRGKVQGGAEFFATTNRPAELGGGSQPEEHSIDRLIPGLSSGMIGIKAGGRRRLTVPPHMAPGVAGIKDTEGNYRIPPDATLVYVIDAISITQKIVPTVPAAAPDPAAPAAKAPAAAGAPK